MPRPTRRPRATAARASQPVTRARKPAPIAQGMAKAIAMPSAASPAPRGGRCCQSTSAAVDFGGIRDWERLRGVRSWRRCFLVGIDRAAGRTPAVALVGPLVLRRVAAGDALDRGIERGVATTRSGSATSAGAGSTCRANSRSGPMRSHQASSTVAPVRPASRDSRVMVSAGRPKNGANSPSPALGCWSGRMPTTPPSFSTLNSCRTAGPSARTCLMLSALRTRCRKASPMADSGGGYRIAIGPREASHWLSSSQLPKCGAATISPRPEASAASNSSWPWRSRSRARFSAGGRVQKRSVSSAWRAVVRRIRRCSSARWDGSSSG